MLRRAASAVLPAVATAVAISPSLIGIGSRNFNAGSSASDQAYASVAASVSAAYADMAYVADSATARSAADADQAFAADTGASAEFAVDRSSPKFNTRFVSFEMATKTALLKNEREAGSAELGVMSASGVTRYARSSFESRHSDEFYWPGSGSREGANDSGVADFSENISWGWHHPSGVYNTIPVGAPLIDGDLNIYLGSDDAIRKFSVAGDILWSYAPRGQLAAAPTLLQPGSSRRQKSGSKHMSDATTAVAGEDPWMENSLKPSWIGKGNGGDKMSRLAHLRVGGRVTVRPGLHFLDSANAKEYYREGDVGMITEVSKGEDGKEGKAKILWERTGHVTVAPPSALEKRFWLAAADTEKRSLATTMLVGSTTSGYVFALDLKSGEELWATQASEQISGVKGAVSGEAGVVVAATDRCSDRYCYRYRNLTNPLAPGNSVVRGLVAADGSALWEFKPTSPVWNFVPQYHKTDGTVMFSDIEGNTYCLDLTTGQQLWTAEGEMGTYTQSSAVYLAATNQVFSLGLKAYEDKACNPFQAPGILPACGTWPGKEGWVRAFNASSGHAMWEIETPEPPSSANVGMLNTPVSHTRLVIALGHNCVYNSHSQLWAVDPDNGHIRWKREGPTLWTDMCAGDKEGGDIRRAMGGRAACYPGAWSTPAIDQHGDIYIGNQVGELQRWGHDGGGQLWAKGFQLMSSLNTGVAFQDQSIAFGPGIMAVSTCTSLIVFQTYDSKPTMETNSSMQPYWDADKGAAHLDY